MFMAWALELRETRNRWAHNEPLNGGDAYRAFDSVVVNCDHEPKASYVKLHRTICPFMNLQNVRSWTYPYMKVCSAETRLLDQWVETVVGVAPDRCPTCRP
jgi:hypothetical protein